MTTIRDFYGETKWCEACQTHVHYIMSVNHSFCVRCGGRVRLFDKNEARRFTADVERRKWKAV